jgi:hypothetical protein
MRVHRIAPRSFGAWDHSLALAYQGLAPFSPGEIVELLRDRRFGLSRRAKVTVWRGSLTLEALVRRVRGRGRQLLAPRPALASHMESPVVALGTDWAAENEAALRGTS